MNGDTYREISEVLREYSESRDRARARRQLQIWMVNCRNLAPREKVLIKTLKKML